MSPTKPVGPADVPGTAGAAVHRRGAAGWALLGSELKVLFSRSRTWAMLLALAAIPVLISVVIWLSSSGPAPGGGPPFLDRVSQNGLFAAVTGLVVSVPLFLPLTVGVVAGDTIAGEAGPGTLRYLLAAPAGRLRLLMVKFAGAAASCLAATLAVVAAGAGIGSLLFPVGPVTLLSGDTIGPGESLWRLLLIAGY
ncbi:ABC transporter permease subunit, partial [Arthrobacter deserti]|nr:ABC transporter permease subunit [Arthrobacter deserti]